MDSKLKLSKIDRVIQIIHTRIDQHILLSGEKLPSVRQMAQQLDMSVSTIVEAYQRLISMDVIESRQGSGYYVKSKAISYASSAVKINIDREIDPLWISRQSLDAIPFTIKAGCGWLPDIWLPENLLRKAIKDVAGSDLHHLANYSPTLGYLPLREYIAQRIDPTGQFIHPDQVLLTDSGTQAIDLICRLFLKPNDTVIVDDPSYFNFHALLKTHGVNIETVPFTVDGPDIAVFKQLLVKQPKLYITNSGIHNPTGAVLSLHHAFQILKLAEEANLLIIEDDIFSDFEVEPAIRYAKLAGFNNVIQVGSFSKSISASVRTGYISSKAEWIDALVNLKIATTFSNNLLSSVIIHRVLTHPHYRKYLEELRQKLNRCMSQTIRKLEGFGMEPWVIPKVGMFVWCKVPEQVDVAQLCQLCLEDQVILAPGNAFSFQHNFKDYLRFNVAQCKDENLFKVLEKNMMTLQNINS